MAPSAHVQQLHIHMLCRQALARFRHAGRSASSSFRSWSSRPPGTAHIQHGQQRAAQLPQTPPQLPGRRQLQNQKCQHQQYKLHPWHIGAAHQLPANSSRLQQACSSSSSSIFKSMLSCRNVHYSYRTLSPGLKAPFWASSSSTPRALTISTLAAARTAALQAAQAASVSSSRGICGSARCGTGSWRSWVRLQLGNAADSSSSSSRALFSQLVTKSSPKAAAAAAAAAAAGRRAAGVAAASRQAWANATALAGSNSTAGQRAAVAATAGGWWDTWALWVDRTSGFLLSSLVNALNLVGNKLPVALGLLLVDMAHNNPLLGGSRADSLQQPYLPDTLPAGGFYADGGPAAAALAAAAPGSSSQSSGSSSWREHVQQTWEATGAALSAGARLVWLGFIWLPALLTAPPVLWWGVGRSWWLVLLRLSLEASGPAFIKWGQWAATRHDLFAHDVCDALEQLHTNAPAHSFRYTCNALTKSFNLPPSELFDWIEEEPIACGSIGQVHRGRLSEKGAAVTGCAAGDTVAIKVRHPGVSEAIERDFETMVWLAHTAAVLIPSTRALRLDETLKQFAAPLHEQVDLSREADNLRRFNKNFKRARAVSFPLPLYPLVSPDVLVESFEVGRHISYYIAAERGSHPYRVRLAELGSGTMLQMMLVDNLIHSDLHPGNILVRLEPPHGLLGLAYKTLRSIANPDGPVMRSLAAALERLNQQQQQQQQQDGSNRSRSSSGSSERPAAMDVLTTKSANAGSSSDTNSSNRWDMQWLLDQCAAAGGPAAVVSKVQGVLYRVAAAWLQPHIVLLDVGMATELSREDQTNMVGLFRAFAALDGASVANWVLKFSGPEQACPEPQAFIDDMQVTFEALKTTIAAHEAEEARWKQQQQEREQQQKRQAASSSDGSSDSSSSNVGSGLLEMPEQFDSGAEALGTVLELVRLHGVSLPGHICAVVVTTLILEGWSNKLAPEHSVLRQVQGMFSPAMYSWHDRMDSVVDTVMERGDTALSLA